MRSKLRANLFVTLSINFDRISIHRIKELSKSKFDTKLKIFFNNNNKNKCIKR